MTNISKILTYIKNKTDAVISDKGNIEHYGKIIAEQKELLAGCAYILRTDRAVIKITGPDSLNWLNSLTSQLVNVSKHSSISENIFTQGRSDSALSAPKGLAAESKGFAVDKFSSVKNTSSETLLLSPNGRVEQVWSLVLAEESAYILVNKTHLETSLDFLRKMVFRSKVQIDALDSVVLAGMHHASLDASETLDETALSSAWRYAISGALDVQAIWVDNWSAVQPGGTQYANNSSKWRDAHPANKWHYFEAVIENLNEKDLKNILDNFSLSGNISYEALRIAAFRPDIKDCDELSLPHEYDWLRNAVHLNKGCYRGQESVAKIHNLGHPPRRLVFLQIDGSESESLTSGTKIYALAGQAPDAQRKLEIGKIVSAALHYEEGFIALGLIRRNTDLAKVDIFCETQEGVVISLSADDIVPIDAGKTVKIDRNLNRFSLKNRSKNE